MAELTFLTERQLDKLQTLFNEGMSRAANILNEMIEHKILVNLSQIKLLPLEKVLGFLGEGKSIVNGIYLNFSGVVSGSVLLYFSQGSALILSDLLLERKFGETKEIYELEQSALKEIGNLLTNAYVEVIAKIVKLKILPSPPYIARDMLGAIIESILAEHARSQCVFFSEMNFELPGTLLRGNFLFFTSEDTLDIILRKLS